MLYDSILLTDPEIEVKVEKQAGYPPVQGWVDDRFAGVLEAYVENYRQHEELGSSVHVTVAGKTVVDLWGGWTDEARTKPWTENTLVCMMSVAKGVTAIAVAMLVDRGLLDLDKPVAAYWPEFAQNGKEGLLVR